VASDKDINLKVTLTAKGIEKATKQLKAHSAAVEKVSVKHKKASQTANKLKRNLEGVAQRAGSTAKDFSRMQQGMGGLVQAYATVAANVFALSSAFLVLRRAADLSSMMKSAENFSNRFGVSVERINRQMQEASGGALDFAEALPTINKAVSAGVGIEQMEELTKAATKAAQTFGGSTTEALNRFISAAQRGRVEIIQTLGVVIKTEQAYKDYAATIGKTALELSAVDRQQAILNATIAASAKVFAGVVIDPNPFQQLLVTITDLKDNILTFVTDALTPLIKLFNQSKAAAASLIALIISIVGKRIFPALGDQLVELQKKSFLATKNAAAGIRKVHDRQSKSILQSGVRQNKLTKDQLLKRNKLFNTFYAESLAKHKSFGKSILDEKKKINAAILNEQRSAITKELNIRTGLKPGRRSGAFAGVSNQALENQRNRLILLTKETENARAAANKLSIAEHAKARAFRESAAAITVATARMRADMIAFRAQITTGFQRSFTLTQTSFVTSVRLMLKSWGNFVHFAIASSKGASFAFAAFGRAVGRTAGFIAGAFIKAISIISSLTLVISLGVFVWQKYGDQIRGISEDQRKVLDSLEDMGEEFDVITDRTNKFIAGFDRSSDSMAKFVANMEFVRGTIDSTLNAFRLFRENLALGLHIGSIKNLDLQFTSIINQIDELERRRAEISTEKVFTNAGERSERVGVEDAGVAGSADLFRAITKNMEELTEEGEAFTSLLKEVAKDLGPQIIQNFASLNNLFKSQGLKGFSQELEVGLLKAFKAFGPTTEKAGLLVEILKAGQDAQFFKELKDLAPAELGRTLTIVGDLMEGLGPKALSATRNFVSAGNSLIEANSKLATYFSGIDKLKSASVPNKEQFNFLLDIERALKDIERAGQGSNALDRLGGAISGGDLDNIQKFINIASSTSVEDALGATQKKLKIYKDLIEDSISAAAKLKIKQAEIFLLKNEEETTDARRIEKLELINKAEEESARIRLNTAQSKELASQRIALTVAEKQAEIEKQKVKLAEENLAPLREHLKIIQEVLATEIKLNSLSRQNINAVIQLGGALDHILDLREKLFLNEKRSIALTKSKLQAELNGLRFQKLSIELEARKRRELEAEIELLKVKEAILVRGQLGREASQKERGGLTFFDKESLTLTAEFFIREIQMRAAKVASTFETMGRGFADNLLEGGKDFSRTVVEALKTGLRQIIGKTLKDNITKIFGDIGSSLEKIFDKRTTINSGIMTDQNAGAAPIMGPGSANPFANMVIDPDIGLKEENTKVFQTAMVDNATQQTEKQEIMKNSLDTLKTTLANFYNFALSQSGQVDTAKDTEAGVKKALDTTDLSIDTVDKSPTVENAVVQMSNLTVAASQNNTAGILQGLLNLGATIVTALIAKQTAETVSSGANMLGSVAVANGGILNNPIRALANGSITNGPELALLGEGKNREAVVPLPNNREIPVDLKGEGGDTIEITQNFDFTNSNTDTIATLRNEAKAMGDDTFNRVFTEINKGGKYAKISGRRR